jgi:hypothetical protein
MRHVQSWAAAWHRQGTERDPACTDEHAECVPGPGPGPAAAAAPPPPCRPTVTAPPNTARPLREPSHRVSRVSRIARTSQCLRPCSSLAAPLAAATPSATSSAGPSSCVAHATAVTATDNGSRSQRRKEGREGRGRSQAACRLAAARPRWARAARTSRASAICPQRAVSVSSSTALRGSSARSPPTSARPRRSSATDASSEAAAVAAAAVPDDDDDDDDEEEEEEEEEAASPHCVAPPSLVDSAFGSCSCGC